MVEEHYVISLCDHKIGSSLRISNHLSVSECWLGVPETHLPIFYPIHFYIFHISQEVNRIIIMGNFS